MEKKEWTRYLKPLRLNDQWVSSGSLPAADQSWAKEISDFLRDWYDESEYIHVNTSGTTGFANRIRLRKSTMVQSALFTIKHLGLQEGDRALLCLPARYIAGKMMIVRAIVGNLSLWAIKPESAIRFEEPLAFCAITPHQAIRTLAENPRFFDLTRTIILGGGNIGESLKSLLMDQPSRIFSSYGMTETSSHIALRQINGPEASDWYTPIDPSIRLSTDPDDCLIICAPYLGEDPVHTRDIVRLKDGNHFQWLGRKDNMINSGAIKIFPEVLESKLEGFFPFRFLFFGEADPAFQQRVSMLVETGSNIDLESLLLTLRQELDKFEQPVRIYRRTKLPENANGKVLRKEAILEMELIYENSNP